MQQLLNLNTLVVRGRTTGNSSTGARYGEKAPQKGRMAVSLGCYVLRTDRSELGQERLWEICVLLSRAEDGFAALKGDLGLRPNFHQREGRVDAHIFITVLAHEEKGLDQANALSQNCFLW